MDISNKKKIIHNRYFQICLAVVLLLQGIVFATLFSTKTPYSLLSEKFNSSHLSLSKQVELHKGDTVIGQFISHFNNLGIVAIRFYTHNRINTDYLLFQFKEKNSADWYYSARYKVDQFQNNELFPIGFPVISDSKGKEYEFHITSTNGKKNNAVVIQTNHPVVFEAKYQYPKSEIRPGGSNFITYGLQKVINTVKGLSPSNVDILYFSPFIWYIFLLFLNAQSIFKFRAPVIPNLLIIIVLFISILGRVSGNLDFVTVTVTTAFGCWFVMISYYKFSGVISIYAFLLFLVLSVILTISQQSIAAAWTSNIAYVFLLIGIIQEIVGVIPYIRSSPRSL